MIIIKKNLMKWKEKKINQKLNKEINIENFNNKNEDEIKTNEIIEAPKEIEKKDDNYKDLIKSLIEPNNKLSQETINKLISAFYDLRESVNTLKKNDNLKTNEMSLMSNKINLMTEKMNFMTNELKKVKENNSILMENQKKLWNYLNLISNGRDMIKSIIFNLYGYFGLQGEKETFYQLSQILKSLKTDDLNNKLNDISKEKLNQFLLLSFFLKNFLNKVLHREFAIKEINIDENDEKALKFIPETSFNSFFRHLGDFIDKTIYENQIQILISKAIEDYMDDTKLSDELKYQKGKIFEDDGRTFRPILKKEDIIMISDFLKNIKFRGKGFDELCENWKDENHEIIPIP